MKKRFLFLLVGLNILLISSLSMSIAWFEGARDLYIDNIELKINADADIFISTDDNFEHAKKSLTTSDFGELDKFEPVTTMGAEHSEWINDSRVHMPVFMGQYTHLNVKDPKPEVATRGFFSKQVYLFSNRTMYVTFDSENTVVEPNTQANDKLATKKAKDRAEKEYYAVAEAEIIEKGITDEAEKTQIRERIKKELIEKYHTQYLRELNSIENSLRISLLDRQNCTSNPYTIVDPKKSSSTVFGGRLNTSMDDVYYDFYTDHETNGQSKEILFGDIKSQDHDLVYKQALDHDIPVEGEPTCFNAGTKALVRAIDMEDLKTNVVFYEEMSMTSGEADVSVSEDESKGYLIKLEPYVAHPVTVSVYIEGWDLDNTNCTQEGSFNMSVKFKLYKEAGI